MHNAHAHWIMSGTGFDLQQRKDWVQKEKYFGTGSSKIMAILRIRDTAIFRVLVLKDTPMTR